MTIDLATRWHRLTAPLVPDAARREAEFQRLVTAYQAPTRHYHTLRHLEALLCRLDAARSPQPLLRNPNAIHSPQPLLRNTDATHTWRWHGPAI